MIILSVSIKMPSLVLTLTNNKSVLSAQYFPPILLNSSYECALIDFQTVNSIPNVDETNNLFHYGENELIIIPCGAYEISDIEAYLLKMLREKNNINETISIEANTNTFKCIIRCSKVIDFTKNNSIGSLLGFKKRILKPHIDYESELPINIFKVSTLRVESNITTGSYFNNSTNHSIYEFTPSVPPGYKIMQTPRNLIYLPVTTRVIDNITLKVIDQGGNLIDFRGELISIRLHLKSC